MYRIFVRFVPVIFEICVQVDRYRTTDPQTDTNIAILRNPPGGQVY